MVCNQCSEQLCAETLTFSWTNMTSLSPAVLKSLCISRINQQSGLRSKCGQANACQDVFSVLNHSGLHTWTEIKCSPVYHQSGQTHYFKSGTAAHQLPCCLLFLQKICVYQKRDAPPRSQHECVLHETSSGLAPGSTERM